MALRAPSEAYKGKNGFIQNKTALRNSSVAKNDDLKVIEAQEFAQFIIREMGSPFPTLDELKNYTEIPDTLAGLKERITKLKEEHKADLAKLYNYRVETINFDAIDRYLQTDSTMFFEDLPSDNDWRQYYNDLESLFKSHSKIQSSELKNVIENYRYDYLQRILPMYKRLAEMERSEEEARISRASVFPQNVEEYRSMDVPAAQLRVARYLMADDTKKELMRTESSWALQKTMSLDDLYQTNAEFRAEVQKKVEKLGSRDPRSRPGPNSAT